MISSGSQHSGARVLAGVWFGELVRRVRQSWINIYLFRAISILSLSFTSRSGLRNLVV